MAKYVKTEQGYINMPSFAPAPFKPEGKSYLTFSSSNRFTLAVYDAIKHWNGILEYFSADKVWAVWDGTTTLSAVSDDGEYFLYLRGTGNTKITGFTNGQKNKWVLTGSEIACTGNIENLLDYGIVESGGHPTMASYCYSSMFSDCTALTQAPDLPATTLANTCYGSMFSGCTSLTKAPALPAKTLAISCYSNMFSGCSSLTQAPVLPTTTLKSYCYQLMFEGCTALTQAPALPATTLANYCYSSMFYGCTALTQAPDLPATTLAHWCYHNMFYGCTALTQAPDLPATTLANNCYESMFSGCISLTKAPALPAKTLIGSCYSSMFYGCTSLTQAPELPATSLVANCYDKMFYGCRSIKLSSTQKGEYTQEYIVGYTSNYAYLMFYGTGGTFTGTPVKDTYYLSTDNMIVRDTEVATLNGYVGSMIDNSVSNPLNITGATVGQIAKITAVDESGKPTSWEAVDDRLPKVSASDAGNVLGVEQIGEHEYGYALTHMPTLNDFIPLGITNASPGQFAKVSFVDDFGGPTAWEAADIYEKPASGIPKSDLADDVQTSLAKADAAISYDSQTLTEEHKSQARTNIGAGQPVFAVNVTEVSEGGGYTADKTAAEIEAAYQAGRTIVCKTQARFLIGYIPVELPLVSRNKERVFSFAGNQVVGNGIFAITVNISDSGVEVSTRGVEIYEKPTSGIPKSDLAADVQTSLDKADTAISLGLTAATPGQIIKVKAVQDGKPTEWEAVDMPSGDKWEKIKEITIAEDAGESNALTINADENGNTFRLKKARLCAKFPAYTGASTIPNYSFAMINGKTSGRVSPLLYTNVWPKINTNKVTGTIYYVDVSGAQQIEHAQINGNGSWSDDTTRDYLVYGTIYDQLRIMYGDTLWAKPITSIGGAGMLIYPGCHFVLYGVRE